MYVKKTFNWQNTLFIVNDKGHSQKQNVQIPQSQFK